MGETPVHQAWMIRLLQLFQQRYREQPAVYVASDLMTYFVPGDPRKSLVPDLVVLLESDRRERRVLKLWEERLERSFILEVTSLSTRRKDERYKRNLYEQLGIGEYFLFDPTADYLAPPLQGYRRHEDGRYRPIEMDDRGRLESQQTGILFSLDGELELLLHDSRSGERLLTEAEAERLAREAERLALETEREANQQERAARLLAEARVAELEAELRRLRANQ